MKILKPGKVEQRRFVCPRCGCIFAATLKDVEERVYVRCPHEACHYGGLEWDDGEPYEEPVQDTQTDRGRLVGLLDEMGLLQAEKLASFLIRNGVTFREE